MKFGERLKKRRQELHISAGELASLIGKNRATIYRYEKGDIESVPLDVLDPLAEALDTTPEHLMGWDDKPNKEASTVGELLKIIRTQHHMSIEEFSKEIGISPEDLRKYESGEKYIPIETINIIANYYRLSTASFTSGEKNYKNEDNVRLERFKLWAKNFGHIEFTEEEHNKIIEYAKFLIHIRKEKSHDGI